MNLIEVPMGDLFFTRINISTIISKRLFEFLSLDKCIEVERRSVCIQGNESDQLFELSSRVSRPMIRKAGVPSQHSFRCATCQFVMVVYMPFEAPFFQYLSEASIPSSGEDVFPVGVGHDIDLAVSQPVRNTIVRSREFRNIAVRKVGILSEHEVSLDGP